jgi:hypothetical protein
LRRIKMVLAVAAAMAMMLVAFVAPAIADTNNKNDNDRNDFISSSDSDFSDHNDWNDHHDWNDSNHDNDWNDLGVANDGFFFSPFAINFVTNEDLADELCSPLNSDELNNVVPGCIFGDDNGIFDNNDFHSNDWNDSNHDNDWKDFHDNSRNGNFVG